MSNSVSNTRMTTVLLILNPSHTYGTLEGYRRISSKEKWLRIHNTGEWDDYYNTEHTEELNSLITI